MFGSVTPLILMSANLILKSTVLDRPLSHQEMIQRWSQTLAKREAVRQKVDTAQQEFDGYASDVIEVIGQPTHAYLYLAVLTANISARQ